MKPSDPRSDSRNRLLDQQHLVMEGVSWSCYEDLLAQVGNGSLRITYDHGRMEIMSPLAEHEFAKGGIALISKMRIGFAA